MPQVPVTARARTCDRYDHTATLDKPPAGALFAPAPAVAAAAKHVPAATADLRELAPVVVSSGPTAVAMTFFRAVAVADAATQASPVVGALLRAAAVEIADADAEPVAADTFRAAAMPVATRLTVAVTTATLRTAARLERATGAVPAPAEICVPARLGGRGLRRRRSKIGSGANRGTRTYSSRT
jgi:hypothetical protein